MQSRLRRQQDGFTGAEQALIPIAGALHGANSTYFRTDMAVMNIGTAPSTPSIRYYNRDRGDHRQEHDPGPAPVSHPQRRGDHFLPSDERFSGISDVHGAVRSLSASLRPGDVRRIGGIEDAALASIAEGRPATFRTNFALVETSGETATIRITIRFGAVSGKVTANIAASKDFAVGARQFQLLGNMAREVLGAGRDAYGDLRNLHVEFAHVGGNGAVEVFLASVDNGPGDMILRVD